MAKRQRPGSPGRESSPRAPRSRSAMTQETQMRTHLSAQPGAAALSRQTVVLPRVTAPSLAGMIVQLPPLPPLAAEAVQERFAELVRVHSSRRARSLVEHVGPGDEVLLDIVGYSEGRLIPFSLREGVTLSAAPIAALPAFGEALVGLEVGKSAVIELELPADYPVESLRRRPARFLLDVREATELRPLAVDDPQLFLALGRGEQLDEVMASLASELMIEREEEQIVEAEQRVLDELAARLDVDLPEGLVDEELDRRWAEQERMVALRKGFSDEELSESRAGWRNDGASRAEVRRQLRVSLALKAIADEEGLTVTKEALDLLIAPVAALLGLSEDEVRAELQRSSGHADVIADTALRLLAIEHVMAQVEFRLDEA